MLGLGITYLLVTTAVLLALQSREVVSYSWVGTGKGCWFTNERSSDHFGRSQSIRAQRRALLQKDCGLQIGNEVINFASCQNLTSDVGTDYNLLWTVAQGQNGNSTLRVAIDAAQLSGTVDWVGFGLNTLLEMVGGDALVVQECTSCQSGAVLMDYHLGFESVSGVKSPSRLVVNSRSAVLDKGRLQGIAEISFDSTGNMLSMANALYAAGPLDSQGSLLQHIFYETQYLDLSPGESPSLAPIASLSSPSSAPQPASAAQPASTAGVTTSGAASPATAPSPSASSSSSSCVLELKGGGSRSFAKCSSLTTSTTTNTGLRLLWTLATNSSGNGSVMVGALESGSATSWAGFAFAAQAGVMLGANAIIVKPCSSCATGASADKYLLSSYSTSGVVAGTGNLDLLAVEASTSPSGGIYALFNLSLSTAQAGSADTNILASVGPLTSGEALAAHPVSNAFSGTVNLASGLSSGLSSLNVSSGKKQVCHGVLMIVGWGLLLPIGVVFARFKEYGPIWFHLHRFTQALAYTTGLGGAIIGAVLGRVQGTHLEDSHRIIGLVVFILLTLQVLAIFWRPAPKASKLRYSWIAAHWIIGGSAIFLAFSNVFLGLKITDIRSLYSGLYALAFGLILLAWTGKGLVTLLQGRRRGALQLKSFEEGRAQPQRAQKLTETRQ